MLHVHYNVFVMRPQVWICNTPYCLPNKTGNCNMKSILKSKFNISWIISTNIKLLPAGVFPILNQLHSAIASLFGKDHGYLPGDTKKKELIYNFKVL